MIKFCLTIYLLGFALLGQAKTIHILICYDMENTAFGPINQQSESIFRERMYDISKKIQYGFSLKNFEKKLFTSENVKKYIAGLKVQSNDIFFFFFSGYGYYLPNQKTKFPYLKFKEFQKQTPVSQLEIASWMAAKKPKLQVLYTDCLSKDIKLPPQKVRESALGMIMDHSINNFRKLFLENCGTVQLTSAMPGESALVITPATIDMQGRIVTENKGSAFTKAYERAIKRSYKKTFQVFNFQVLFDSTQAQLSRYINPNNSKMNKQTIHYEIVKCK